MSSKGLLLKARGFQIVEHWILPRLLSPFHSVTVLNDPGPALGKEPCIIGSTHRSVLDHPFVVLELSLETFQSIAPVRFIAKGNFSPKEFFWWPPFRQFYRWFYQKNMIIPVEKAIHGSVEALVDQRTSVLIYPEGRIWQGVGVGPLRKGIVAIHKQSRAPIWLVGLHRERVSTFRWRVVLNWDTAPISIPEHLDGDGGLKIIHRRLTKLLEGARAHGRRTA